MTNPERILEWLSDGQWHCGTEIGYMWDLRKRISELVKSGMDIQGAPCDGRCGTKHKSKNLKMRRLIQKVSLGVELPPMPIIERRMEELSGQKSLFVT